MRLPLPQTVANVGPGGGIVTSMLGQNALLNSMYQNQVSQAQGQYAPQMQSAQIANLRMGPIAQVLGNPFLASTMDPNSRTLLLNALMQNIQGGGGGASLPGNNYGTGNASGYTSAGGNGGGNAFVPTMPGAQNSPNNINSHVIATTAGTANPSAVNSAQNNIATINNERALLGDPNVPGTPAYQMEQVSQPGIIWGNLTGHPTQAYTNAQNAINTYNKNTNGIVNPLTLSITGNGTDLYNQATANLNALTQKYVPQQKANALAAQTGNFSSSVGGNTQQTAQPAQTAQPTATQTPTLKDYSSLSSNDQDTLKSLNFNGYQNKILLGGGIVDGGNGKYYQIKNNQLLIGQ